jgi:polyvinyl alcohol dehydrogenase (cytochrome)
MMTKPGYTGAAVWSSTPVVDEERGALIVTTGNNYSVPAGSQEETSNTISAGNYVDSVVALDLKSGAVKWAQSPRQVADTWNVGNLFGTVHAI